MKEIMPMFGAQSPQKSISEQTAYEIDEEVRSLLNEARNKAAEIIQSNRETHKLNCRSTIRNTKHWIVHKLNLFMKQERCLKQ